MNDQTGHGRTGPGAADDRAGAGTDPPERHGDQPEPADAAEEGSPGGSETSRQTATAGETSPAEG